jgi:basic membrane protein A
MRQLGLIVSISVFTILFVAVLIILNFNKKTADPGIMKAKTNVGLLLSGPPDDMSWSSTHYSAVNGISEDLNLEVICRENVPADENCAEVIRSLVEDEHCLVVIAASYDYGKYMEEAAGKYPDVYFIHAAGTAAGKNICSFTGRMYQYRYLSGIVAGTQTKTNSIGYVAAFPITGVNVGINAFTLGVRSVNPDAVVHVAFTGSWTDDRAAGDAAEKLVSEYGADVITLHTDSLAPLDYAEEHGVWTIGYSCDNSGRYPKSYLTACVWHWDSYYREQILSCIQGKFKGEHRWLGYDSGIMELIDPAKSGNADPAYNAPLEAAKARFGNYSFDVFYGPVTDNTGNIRVAESESLSDETMLTSFDWYVEGVQIGQ